MSHKKIHSEYRFSIEVKKDHWIGLDVYINYRDKTYDIQQDNDEGIFFRNNNTNVIINKAYVKLALEALDFIEKELYSDLQ